MSFKGLTQYLLVFCFVQILGPDPVQAQDLDELESMGSELDQEQEPSANLPETTLPQQENAVPTSTQPVSDLANFEAIDIQKQIKKVQQPNLFAGVAAQIGNFRELAMGEAPEDYEVQLGDNLYDICDQLIDEAGYWPKLWAFNPNINNPHFIYPGMHLRFHAGDTEQPPYLQVVTEDDVLPVNKGQVNESELVKEDIEAMLMRAEVSENTKLLGSNELNASLFPSDMIWDEGGRYSPKSIDILIPAFIVADRFEIFGTVVGGASGSFLVDDDEDLIVEQKEGLKVGSSYSIVRPSSFVEDDEGNNIGYRYEFVAQVKLQTQDRDDDDIFKGKVSLNRLGVQPGDLLVAYRSVKRSLPFSFRQEGKASFQKVVSFEEYFGVIGGARSFIFVDQANGQLKEGETYQILQNMKVVAPYFLKDKLPNTDSKVAWVYILDISGAAATGYIVRSNFEVRPGDRLSP